MRGQQAGLQQPHDDDQRQRQPVQRADRGQLVAEKFRWRQPAQAHRTVGQPGPVQDHQRDDLADAQGRDRHVMTAHAQRGIHQQSPQPGGDEPGEQHRQIDRQPKIQRQQPRRVPADRQQRRLSQRDLPHRAGHQCEAQSQQCRQQPVGQRLQQIRFGEQRQACRRGDDRRHQPARHPDGPAAGDESAGQRFGGQVAAAAEQPVGGGDQDQDQQHEGEQVSETAAEKRDAVTLGQAQQQPAADRARHVAQPANHHRHHALQGGVETHVGIDAVVIHPDQHAADPAQRRGDGEHGHVHPIGVHAHLTRSVLILRRRPHRPTKLAEPQESIQCRRTGQAHRRDQQIERPDRASANPKPHIRQLARQRARIGRAQQLHELVQHQADADRRQQRRDARSAVQRAQSDPLDRNAQQPAADQHQQQGHQQRRVQEREAGPADIGADGVNRTVREIDQVGDAEDQREANGQQRVDVADDQTVDGVVQPGADHVAGLVPSHNVNLSLTTLSRW